MVAGFVLFWRDYFMSGGTGDEDSNGPEIPEYLDNPEDLEEPEDLYESTRGIVAEIFGDDGAEQLLHLAARAICEW